MDKVKEKKYFYDIKTEIHEARTDLLDRIEEGRKTVRSAKEYIGDNYEDMDVNELRENVDDVNNMIDVYETLVRHARELAAAEKTPYFGKVVFKPEGASEMELRIGTTGFWSEKDAVVKIHDWRAPVSSLYYEFEKGPAYYYTVGNDEVSRRKINGAVTEKAQFVVRDGELVSMTETDERISDELLIAALGGNAAESMKPVIATIQKEQNEIIRDTSKVLVVDGRAGSGKTVVGMHRLAWLLYNKRNTLKSDDCLVLAPNAIFSEYAAGFLPELAEEPVPEKQWDDLLDEIVFSGADYETRAEQAECVRTADPDSARIKNIRLKTSVRFFEAFESYFEEIFLKSISFKDYKYEKVTFPAEKLEKLFFGSLSSLPVYDRFYNIAYFILDDAMLLNGRNFGESRMEKIQHQIQAQLIERFARPDIIGIYTDFLQIVGKVYPEAINCYTEDGRITYEDMQVLFYLQLKLYGCGTYRDIKQCLIDEMQDYSVFQFAIIKELIGGNLTILGDHVQTLLPDEEENVLDAVLKIFPERTLKVMNRSYRSTAEITAFCNSLTGDDENADTVDRHGPAPEIKSFESFDGLTEFVKKKLDEFEASGFESAAVLFGSEEEAYALYKNLGDKKASVRYLSEQSAGYRGGAVITSAFLAKGMEFDTVITVCEKPLEKVKESTEERAALYIAATRALHELSVCELLQ